MKSIKNTLLKKRKGSTLFFTIPVFLVVFSYAGFVFAFYSFKFEDDITPLRAPGIETEIDEEYYEYECWFALLNKPSMIF